MSVLDSIKEQYNLKPATQTSLLCVFDHEKEKHRNKKFCLLLKKGYIHRKVRYPNLVCQLYVCIPRRGTRVDQDTACISSKYHHRRLNIKCSRWRYNAASTLGSLCALSEVPECRIRGRKQRQDHLHSLSNLWKFTNQKRQNDRYNRSDVLSMVRVKAQFCGR